LSSDKCTTPDRIEIIVKKKERERECGQFLPEEVQKEVENTSKNIGVRRVRKERERTIVQGLVCE